MGNLELPREAGHPAIRAARQIDETREPGVERRRHQRQFAHLHPLEPGLVGESQLETLERLALFVLVPQGQDYNYAELCSFLKNYRTAIKELLLNLVK